ncbi:MAG: tetratricopeptide repeat-containing sulfotransferase family protein, partial [Gammaproteobacteria bacterium]
PVYTEALVYAPQDPELTCALAELLVEMGRADEAVALLDTAQAISGHSSDIDYYRGIAQITLGQFKVAETSFRQAITQTPDFYHAYVHLTATTKIGLVDPIYPYLENAAHSAHLETAEQQVNAHFSLGKILQDNREYDHAFEHFNIGNRACRTLRPYSHSQQLKQAAALENGLNKDFINSMRPYGNQTDLPVFIVGMPRSGTTLTEQILARHPTVHSGGEMVLLHNILRRQLGQQYRRELAAGLLGLDTATFSGIATELISGLQRQANDALRMTDKMPSNFLLTGWLHALLPNARIIHCRRDPLDTCVSCYTTLFNRGHEFSNDLNDLGLYYRVYLDMMARWRALLPADRLLEIDYESLVADPEPIVRNLLDFIGLPWHQDCLDFGKTSKTVQTASVLQVRQPLYASSVGRWRHYASHLAPLRTALGLSG